MPSTPLTTITSTPRHIDPLPVYTRDPETLSVRSSAPSYVSEAPTYHSARPENHRAATFTTGLQPATLAPGYNRLRPSGSISEVSNHKFNISEWSSVVNGHQARHYQNVAHRRATIADAEEEVNAVAAAMSRPTAPEETVDARLMTSLGLQDLMIEEIDSGPTSPLEDPDLVGPEAARRAKERRIYMARCKNNKEAMRQENKTWDFMLAQMADWKEREKSWEKFRNDMASGKSGILGKRIGFGRKGSKAT